MSKFKQIYKEIMMPMLPMYGLGEIVSYGGFRWEVIGFEPNEKEQCWVYDLRRVDGTDETESGIFELGLTKSFELVEKPGATVHTPKWDRCVKQVEDSGSGANAFAVCTAMLGNDAFKSLDDQSFEDKVKFYMQKLGITGAGPVPHSLLAGQDLEGEKTTKSLEKGSDLDSFSVWYYDGSGARKCAVFGTFIDAEAYAGVANALGYNDIKIVKGQVEQTGKQLQRLTDKAADATETEEQKSLVDNIKAVQIKRQKATIVARAKEATKSFKQNWVGINKSDN